MSASLGGPRDADGPNACAEELSLLAAGEKLPAGKRLGDRGGELGQVEIGTAGTLGLDGAQLADLAVDLTDALLGFGQGAEA